MDIQQFAEQNNLKDKDMVGVIQTEFPKYSKQIHSHVKNQQCGITLVEKAVSLLTRTFSINAPEALRARKSDRHKLTDKVSCRLEPGLKPLLQQRFREDGFETDNEGLKFLINQYLGVNHETH